MKEKPPTPDELGAASCLGLRVCPTCCGDTPLCDSCCNAGVVCSCGSQIGLGAGFWLMCRKSGVMVREGGKYRPGERMVPALCGSVINPQGVCMTCGNSRRGWQGTWDSASCPNASDQARRAQDQICSADSPEPLSASDLLGSVTITPMTNNDNSLLRDCMVAASGPKTVKTDDPNLCAACEGARRVLINMGPRRGVEWHTCKACDGTGWQKPNKL